MAAVIPMRPFRAALDQAQRAGRLDLRTHCAAAVARELRAGRNGHAIAGQLYDWRKQQAHHSGGAA